MEYKKILSKNEGIIEPKNIVFSKYFDSIYGSSSMEEMANIVVARAYEDFINEYKIF